MSNRNPASVLVDSAGNIIGSSTDGTSYRLKVDALMAAADGSTVDLEVTGTRTAQAVSYPQLLDAVLQLSDQMNEVLLHLREVTGETP
jgi:hypothetical protein